MSHTARVVMSKLMRIGHADYDVQEFRPGDVVELDTDEATEWCLRRWAVPERDVAPRAAAAGAGAGFFIGPKS